MARHDRAAHGDRGLRDEANVGPDPRAARELRPMRELKHFKVADGEPDIRGWRVFTSSGRELGRVEDLLVDTEAGEVVMLDVDLRRDDRHTLAPIRAAWIDRDHERVIIDSRELETDEGLPTLARGRALSDADVRQFGDRYDRAYGERALEGERDYHVRHHTDDLRFGRRRSDDAARAAAAADGVTTTPPPALTTRPVEREIVRDRGSDEARAVNETLGARDPVIVVREPRAAEREARLREADAAADAAAARQVRYPATNPPAGGRVIEEVVVRRREVGPDDGVGR